MESIWTAVKATLKEKVPGHSYRMWIEPLDVMSFYDNRLVVSSPNFFSRKRVVDNYAGLIEKEAERILGEKCLLAI